MATSEATSFTLPRGMELPASEVARIQQRRQLLEQQSQQLEASLLAIQQETQANQEVSPTSEPESIITTSGVQPNSKTRVQRLLETRFALGALYTSHGEWRLACCQFEAIIAWIATHELAKSDVATPASNPSTSRVVHPIGDERVPPELERVLEWLKLTALTNAASLSFRMQEPDMAMAYLLDAKKLLRERRQGDRRSDDDRETVVFDEMELTLTVNYAVLLLAQGREGDAMRAAESALAQTYDHHADSGLPAGAVASARATAHSLLSSCHRRQGDLPLAHEHAAKAVAEADAAPASVSSFTTSLVSIRAHNNAALCCVEGQDLLGALRHLLTAYRALTRGDGAGDLRLQGLLKYHLGLTLSALKAHEETAISDDGGEATGFGNAGECFRQSQILLETAATTSALTTNEPSRVGKHTSDDGSGMLAALARATHGQSQYFTGSFYSAETELTAALEALRAPQTKVMGSTHAHAFVESCLGTALLVQGKLAPAELAHQHDLECALQSEDIHAQLRALRNLALVYNAQQRYVEAVPLWREALEIATVLQSPRDLMAAYSGLGTACKELQAVSGSMSPSDEDMDPRPLFLKQRALAMELGDEHAEVSAQRHVVATYEGPGHDHELEQRLEECDHLVRLSERDSGDATARADSYRALANALTAQIARLRERGQRFAEAIIVLSHKRNAIAQRFRALASDKITTMHKSERTSDSTLTPQYDEDYGLRAQVARVDVLPIRI